VRLFNLPVNTVSYACQKRPESESNYEKEEGTSKLKVPSHSIDKTKFVGKHIIMATLLMGLFDIGSLARAQTLRSRARITNADFFALLEVKHCRMDCPCKTTQSKLKIEKTGE
jgi:hypothetical protein